MLHSQQAHCCLGIWPGRLVLGSMPARSHLLQLLSLTQHDSAL